MYVWLSPFAVCLKLSHHCLSTGYTPIQNKKLFKKKRKYKQKKKKRVWGHSGQKILGIPGSPVGPVVRTSSFNARCSDLIPGCED